MRLLQAASVVLLSLALMAVMAACQSEDDRPASYGYIFTTILAPNCATSGCHSEFGDVQDIRLDDYDEAYRILAGGDCDPDQDPPGGRLVLPGQPDASLLINAMRGLLELNMPPDRPLPEKDIELVEQWVMEGAKCN